LHNRGNSRQAIFIEVDNYLFFLRQMRILLIATLAYSSLLPLLNPDPVDKVAWMLRNLCLEPQSGAELFKLHSIVSACYQPFLAF